jgi:DNA polymerase-3 subunit epsilon
VDLETTGLDPRRHRIVSVAWVALDTDLHLSTARHSLLREAQGGGEAVHGILHRTRARGASLDRVLADFLQAATGRVLVAHHLEVETGFLEAAIRRSWGLDLPLVGVDTLALERRLERGAPSRGLPDDAPGAFRLPAVRARYGLPAYPLHDALSDALAAGELFLAQRARLLARRGKLTLGDLA